MQLNPIYKHSSYNAKRNINQNMLIMGPSECCEKQLPKLLYQDLRCFNNRGDQSCERALPFFQIKNDYFFNKTFSCSYSVFFTTSLCEQLTLIRTYNCY